MPVCGYVAIEKDLHARRVVESHFPSCVFVEDLKSVTSSVVQKWAAQFPTCRLVLVAGGPPCQGVSFLNIDKKGAFNDPRSSLFQDFCKVRTWMSEVFSWCPCFFLMESVAGMAPEDRSAYSRGAGVLPYEVDSKGISPCKRSRLRWFKWTFPEQLGVSIYICYFRSTRLWDN